MSEISRNQSVDFHEDEPVSEGDGGLTWGRWSCRFMRRSTPRWGLSPIPWLGLLFIGIGRVAIILTWPIQL